VKLRRKTRIVLVVLALAAGALLALAFRPRAVPVETTAVKRADLKVVTEASGQTRVRNLFEVLAPVSGQLQRIALEPGDQVERGMQVAAIAPIAPTPLDARARAEAEARLAAAVATERQSRASLSQAQLASAQALRDLERSRRLTNAGAIPRQDFELKRLAARTRAAEVKATRDAVARAQAEVEAAKAALQSGGPGRDHLTKVASPSDGEVLKVVRESEGPIQAGAPLLQVGQPDDLEIVLDVLTSQAVAIDPGDEVEIVQWGGPGALEGQVWLIEPSAFTKVSALGVEEQRVNVIVEPPEGTRWKQLSDGYHVEARIVTDIRPKALTVPSTALFRRGNDWALFVVQKRRARIRTVKVGAMSQGIAEIQEGLVEGEQIVAYPSDQVSDGTRIKPEHGSP
jgi:HlyD family secretion protein